MAPRKRKPPPPPPEPGPTAKRSKKKIKKENKKKPASARDTIFGSTTSCPLVATETTFSLVELPLSFSTETRSDPAKFNKLIEECLGPHLAAEKKHNAYGLDNLTRLKANEEIIFRWPKQLLKQKPGDPFISSADLISTKPQSTQGILISLKKSEYSIPVRRTHKHDADLDFRETGKVNGEVRVETVSNYSFAKRERGKIVNYKFEVQGALSSNYSFFGEVPDMALLSSHLRNKNASGNLLFPQSEKVLETLRANVDGAWNQDDATFIAEEVFSSVRKSLDVNAGLKKIENEVDACLEEMVSKLVQDENDLFLNSFSLTPYRITSIINPAPRIIVDDDNEELKKRLSKKRIRDKTRQGADSIPNIRFIKWSPESRDPFPTQTQHPKPFGASSDLFDRISRKFQERPIWSSAALCTVLGLNYATRPLFKYLPYFSIRVNKGAFDDCYIRYGYNPLKNKISRIYQIVRIETVTQLALDEYKRKHNKSLEIYGFNVPRKLCIQLLDINDQQIRTLIKCQVPKGTSFGVGENIGWLSKDILAVIRERLKDLIGKQCLQANSIPDTCPTPTDENWTEIKLNPGQTAVDFVGAKVPVYLRTPSASDKYLSKSQRRQGVSRKKTRYNLDNSEDESLDSSSIASSVIAPVKQKFSSLSARRDTSKKSSLRSTTHLSRGQKLWGSNRKHAFGLQLRVGKLNIEKNLQENEEAPESESGDEDETLPEKMLQLEEEQNFIEEALVDEQAVDEVEGFALIGNDSDSDSSSASEGKVN